MITIPVRMTIPMAISPVCFLFLFMEMMSFENCPKDRKKSNTTPLRLPIVCVKSRHFLLPNRYRCVCATVCFLLFVCKETKKTLQAIFRVFAYRTYSRLGVVR